ncbi:16S rRNA (guanine(527)-N(7))-methyltransferase RsmG [Treponema berlinense]|uniref:16S rRNA (guanine(527)-N(7))-methyltransferase RsmG n=1 Tax=Treponema berlinense TaxID=225004 RepID=UPI0026ED469C|nr:16S rRNA (guanine(527)-N(7))-methyltransferase RsmG [Treponema berlinense]
MNFLHEGLVQLGFEKGSFCGIKTLPLPELEEKLDLYIKILLEFNEKFDLINTDTYDQTAVRQILDSLSGAEKVASLCAGLIEKTGTDLSFGCQNLLLADIGSGAGLPGIPLAAAFPSLNFTLVERMSKRCSFLLTCAQKLDLQNVTVEENQAERLEQNRFDLCVFRAFRPLDKKMLKVLRRILKQGGKLAAYKARSEKIQEEMSALEAFAPKYAVEKLTVPFLTENTAEGEERERNLVVIEK